MKWYHYVILLMATVLLSYTQESYQLSIDMLFIGCFLVLRYEVKSRILLVIFLYTLTVDFLCLGSLVKGVSTLVFLPIVFLGNTIKNYVLPSFSDLFLFVYFFLSYIVYYYSIRWFYGVFGVTIPSVPAIFLGFNVLVHAAVFGAILIIIGRIGKKR